MKQKSSHKYLPAILECINKHLWESSRKVKMTLVEKGGKKNRTYSFHIRLVVPTCSSKWYFNILCTGFRRYEPKGKVWCKRICLSRNKCAVFSCRMSSVNMLIDLKKKSKFEWKHHAVKFTTCTLLEVACLYLICVSLVRILILKSNFRIN